MSTPKQYLNSMTVTTVQDLAALWSSVLADGGFGRRSLHVLILDDEGRPAPVVVPIDDIPEVPTAAEIDGFGRLLEHLEGFGTPVLLLSRPGPSAVMEPDRQWARALQRLTPRWPVHLGTEDAFGRGVITSLSHATDARDV